jgi:antitoxin component YwqK of YwqJK toxin-antitoxin module
MRLLNKSFTLILVCLAVLIGCEKAIDTEQLQERQGIFYEVNSTEPFTGTVVDLYETGQKQSERNYVGGKLEGLATEWYQNGQKHREQNYVDGKQAGLSTLWHESGQKEGEGNFADGKEDGLHTQWYENGQKEGEGNFVEGKREGLYTHWGENGQKKTKRRKLCRWRGRRRSHQVV